MPKTRLGKWAVGLLGAMPVLFVAGKLLVDVLYPAVPAGNTPLEDLAIRPVLVLFMLAGITAGISAFITGFIAIIKQKERSPAVVVAAGIGAFIILFLVGEFLFPH